MLSKESIVPLEILSRICPCHCHFQIHIRVAPGNSENVGNEFVNLFETEFKLRLRDTCDVTLSCSGFRNDGRNTISNPGEQDSLGAIVRETPSGKSKFQARRTS